MVAAEVVLEEDAGLVGVEDVIEAESVDGQRHVGNLVSRAKGKIAEDGVMDPDLVDGPDEEDLTRFGRCGGYDSSNRRVRSRDSAAFAPAR